MKVERYMHRISRHACLALLLALLISHTSVAVHAAVHEMGDSVECQLCSSFGNVAPVATAGDDDCLSWQREVPAESVGRAVPDTHRVAPPGQRGPPHRH
jgi:hypothetical protein